jgi:hypothetical protein
VVVERLSNRHIAAVEAVTGANALGALFQNDLQASLGLLGRLERKSLRASGARDLHARPPLLWLSGYEGKSPPAASQWAPEAFVAWQRRAARRATRTVVLRGGDRVALEELEHSVQSAVTVLGQVLRLPRVVEGGGQFERKLAALLLERAAALKTQAVAVSSDAAREGLSLALARRERAAVHQGVVDFAACLTACADAIQGDGSADGELADPWVVKQQVLVGAVEAAAALMGVDSMLLQGSTH